MKGSLVEELDRKKLGGRKRLWIEVDVDRPDRAEIDPEGKARPP